MHSADLKTSTSARTIKLDDGPLRIEDIIDIAEGRPVSYYPIRMNSALALTEGRISSTVCCAKRVRSMVSPPATAIRAP
jgi:hypothetical protein